MSKVGHNSKKAASGEVVAVDRLRAFIQRIERLDEERSAISADIREIYAELKGDGFSAPVIRALVQRRKKDKTEMQEFDALLKLYSAALGEAL